MVEKGAMTHKVDAHDNNQRAPEVNALMGSSKACFADAYKGDAGKSVLAGFEASKFLGQESVHRDGKELSFNTAQLYKDAQKAPTKDVTHQDHSFHLAANEGVPYKQQKKQPVQAKEAIAAA